MHIFLTGGTGFVGPPTLRALLQHGHTVLALARSDASASKLTAAGATEILRGDLSNLDSLREGARRSDGVVHIAWTFSFEGADADSFSRAMLEERAAIEAMVEAMKGTGKALVVANGTLGVSDLEGGREATEEDEVPDDGTAFALRGETERLLKVWGRERGARAMTVRLAPIVHGEEDVGFVPMFGALADQNECVVHPIVAGKQQQKSIPAVHKRDAAEVFCLALEKGKAGAVYHATAENVGQRTVLEAVAREKGMQVRDVAGEEGMRLVGAMGMVMVKDNPVSSARTRRELGWEPSEKELLEDIAAHYFK